MKFLKIIWDSYRMQIVVFICVIIIVMIAVIYRAFNVCPTCVFEQLPAPIQEFLRNKSY